MTQNRAKDAIFMRLALDAARRGEGFVHPNPLVGAVLVKNGRVIASGAHERFGGAHAEVNAISRASGSLRGATLYVTLEPCVHFGKTPPCVDLILRRKIRKVVIAAKDPNPRVNGRGIRKLKVAGVKVVTGVLEKEARELNQDLSFWIKTGRPYAVAKIGQSLDGKIATDSGRSRWITGAKARAFGHGLRASSDGILIGVETVLKDDPVLSVRHGRGNARPLKIVLDSRLRTPLTAKLFSGAPASRVILATVRTPSLSLRKAYEKKAEILVLPQKKGRVDLKALFETLGRRGVVRLLIEGGGEVLAGAFREGLVQELCFFVAPLVIGGKSAVSSVGGDRSFTLEKAPRLRKTRVEFVGQDILIRGEL